VQKSDVIEKLARGDQSYDPASISEGSRLHQQQVAIKLDRRKPKRSGRQLADTASDKPENRLRRFKKGADQLWLMMVESWNPNLPTSQSRSF
jgi:hypothetical protein